MGINSGFKGLILFLLFSFFHLVSPELLSLRFYHQTFLRVDQRILVFFLLLLSKYLFFYTTYSFDSMRLIIIKYIEKNCQQKFKCGRLNAGCYSLHHCINWQHKLPKNSVNVYCPKCVWTDGGHISVCVQLTLFLSLEFYETLFYPTPHYHSGSPPALDKR